MKRAIIFDIDGTLAINNSGRSPYDMRRVFEDDPNPAIISTAQDFYQLGYDIIICSGRTDDGKQDTEKWLKIHNVKYHALYMRKNKDMRSDFIVKEEMWRKIIETNYIISMYDDRNQVVNHARSLGFIVCQVADGNF